MVYFTPQFAIVAGARITHGKKSGHYESGGVFVGTVESGTTTGVNVSAFRYSDTQPSYTVGLNYKPRQDVLVYGKHSFSYVSGGSMGGVNFANETARAWEAGIKADLLDRRLRANLAVYSTKYRNLQSAQSGQNVGRPELGTVVIRQGNSRAKKAELELTLLPTTELTLGGSVGYVDVEYGTVNPILVANPGCQYLPTLISKWSGNLFGQYETKPLFGNATGLIRVDATRRSRQRTSYNSTRSLATGSFAATAFSPRAWVVNGRVALRSIDVGPLKTDVAVWGRNLNNNRLTLFRLTFNDFSMSSTFQQVRTYGADFFVNF